MVIKTRPAGCAAGRAILTKAVFMKAKDKESLIIVGCPLCGNQLHKRKNTAEGVKSCSNCENTWFILRTSGPRIVIRDKGGKDGAEH